MPEGHAAVYASVRMWVAEDVCVQTWTSVLERIPPVWRTLGISAHFNDFMDMNVCIAIDHTSQWCSECVCVAMPTMPP